jgi:hypothetical protein
MPLLASTESYAKRSAAEAVGAPTVVITVASAIVANILRSGIAQRDALPLMSMLSNFDPRTSCSVGPGVVGGSIGAAPYGGIPRSGAAESLNSVQTH